jgi:hypothetical protein
VEVFGCPHEGISVGDGQFRAVNCHAHDNGYAGLDIGSTYLPAQVIGGSYHDNGETFGTGDGYGVTAHSGRILMVGVQAYGNYTVQLDVHGSNTVAALFEGCQVWCNGTEHQNPTTFASSAWGISVTVSAREVLIKGCQFHGIRTRNQAGAINVTADISSLDGNYNVAIEGNTFADFQPKTALILCRPFDTKTLRVSGNQCRNCSGSGLPYFLFIEPLATETPLHRRKIPRLVEITGNVIDGGSRIEVKAGSLISIHDNLAADVETHTEDGGGLQRDLITVSTDNTAVGRVQTYNNREISYRRNNVQQFASAPTVWTWKRGDRAQNSLGAAVGDTVGWYCTTSGTFKTGTVSATTTAGGRTITVPAGDIRKFVPGQFLAVVGVTWGTALADRVELLAVDETTNELTVAYNASATVTANLSWPAPTFAKFEVLS